MIYLRVVVAVIRSRLLVRVLLERDRRIHQNQPQIDTITPTELPPSETTTVIIRGNNLNPIATIDLPDNEREIIQNQDSASG